MKVGFDTKDKGDQLIEIFNNQKVTIGNSNSKDGSQTITIWKNFTETVKKGDATIAIEKGKRSTTIEGDEALTINTGNRTSTISKGDDAVTISQGDQSVKIGAGKHVTQAAQSILLKVGQ